MRMSYPILATIGITLLFTGCSTAGQNPSTQATSNFINRQTVVSTTKHKYPPKNPHKVALYTKEKTPHTAYRVIGVATVSKYNLLGMPREDTTLHEMMKTLAASIGGDGVINIDSNNEHIKANVIAFQKILI